MADLALEGPRRSHQPVVPAALRVLHVEADPDDAEAVRATLAEEGLHCSIERVTERSEFLAALKRGGIDVILAEYQLPLFDGIGALAIAHELCREVPFIFVSGAVGEEIAIETLKSGATDYVLKRRMARLGLAVRRALDEVARGVERDRLEGLLHQAQKMETAGRLAGSVAHGFNDLLTVILGRGEALRRRLERDDPGHADCDEILKAAVLAAALSRKLLAVSRQQLLESKPVDLNDTVRQMESVLKGLLGNDIELVTNRDERPACVKVDPGQWEQAIMNMAVNAREAMPQGGRLMVETGHLILEGESASGTGLAPGSYVTLSVSDTGSGMDDATRARMFEPFFTTKETGEGAGLGISAVQGIVKQSGGHIEVFSEVGRGTMVRILLPDLASGQPRESDADMIPPAGGLDAGTESVETVRPVVSAGAGPEADMTPATILLVEDEPMVCKMVSRALRDGGHQVFETPNGEEALAFGQKHPGSLTLLITDVVMPRLDGPQLFQRLAPLQPGMRVIYMSGYTDDRMFQPGLLNSLAGFLPKPFTPQTLLDKVASVLAVEAMGAPGGPASPSLTSP